MFVILFRGWSQNRVLVPPSYRHPPTWPCSICSPYCRQAGGWHSTEMPSCYTWIRLICGCVKNKDSSKPIAMKRVQDLLYFADTHSKNLWLGSYYLCTRISPDIPLLFNAITFENLVDFRSSPELVVWYLLINTVYCLYFRTKELRLTVTVRGFTRPGSIVWWALRRKRRPNWRTTPQGDLRDEVVLSM